MILTVSYLKINIVITSKNNDMKRKIELLRPILLDCKILYSNYII